MTVDNLVSGLVGAVIGGIATFVAAYFGARWAYNNQVRFRDQDREVRMRAALRTRVGFDGTFLVENGSDESLRVTVTQRRLFVDLTDAPAKDMNEKRELYRLIDTGDGINLVSRVEPGNTKVSGSSLSAHEAMEIPECEMFGFTAEKIREVLIGTVIQVDAEGLAVCFRRLYVHRFTMGGIEGPHPQARWHQLYSTNLAVEASK